MPKYLIRASYTPEGAKGILKAGGSARRKAVEDIIASVHGRVEAFYFAFGEDDAVMIIDIPDPVDASAIGLAVTASGSTRTKTTVLITPEEVDAASKKQIVYHRPGE